MDGEQNGDQFDIDSGIAADLAGEGGSELPAPTAEVASAQPSTAVDLAAWARGEKEYPFHEVVKGIDDYVLKEIDKIVEARFVGLNSRADAVQFLIDEGFISSAEARGDV